MWDDVLVEARQQCRELAYEMVMLEGWAKEAYARGLWVRVGELHTEREEIQARRSELMRDVWVHLWRRKQRRVAA